MSSSRALKEIDRFLSEDQPEVISITGRWGVGKTTAWKSEIDRRCKGDLCSRQMYAYVSAFGIRSLDNLKSLIFQSTVSLKGNSLTPTWDALSDSLSDEASRKALLVKASRRFARPAKTIIAGLPVVGKLSDLIDFSSSYLISNQIVCIDDIERAGNGLEIQEILGFASFLKEQKNCKVVLLLNDEGLGDSKLIYRKYLEKVMDHSIRFEPTPQEAVDLALGDEPLDQALAERTIMLGVTNIRVIKRIRRFMVYLEKTLQGLHPDVMKTMIASVALLGWTVFEPDLAPKLDGLRGYRKTASRSFEEKSATEIVKLDPILSAYGFVSFDDFDRAILLGLEAGWFDERDILAQALIIDKRSRVYGLQEAMQAPWRLIYNNFDDNVEAIVRVLCSPGPELLEHMSPAEITERIDLLNKLSYGAESDALLKDYLESIEAKPRKYYEERSSTDETVHKSIRDTIQKNLDKLPLTENPKEVLLGITNGWSQEAIKFLSTVSVQDLVEMLQRSAGGELSMIVSNAVRLDQSKYIDPNCGIVATNMRLALKELAKSSGLNAVRVRRLLGYEP
ncbi:hypothetical protein [Lichenicola sp.]|uniref:hypothetical protein n=1 Tax=Lichenicola sp. TaxID=2804529 RepID=UPI003B0082B5